MIKKIKERLTYRTFMFFKNKVFKIFNNTYLLLVSPKKSKNFLIFFPQVFPHFYYEFYFLIKNHFYVYKNVIFN